MLMQKAVKAFGAGEEVELNLGTSHKPKWVPGEVVNPILMDNDQVPAKYHVRYKASWLGLSSPFWSRDVLDQDKVQARQDDKS